MSLNYISDFFAGSSSSHISLLSSSVLARREVSEEVKSIQKTATSFEQKLALILGQRPSCVFQTGEVLSKLPECAAVLKIDNQSQSCLNLAASIVADRFACTCQDLDAARENAASLNLCYKNICRDSESDDKFAQESVEALGDPLLGKECWAVEKKLRTVTGAGSNLKVSRAGWLLGMLAIVSVYVL